MLKLNILLLLLLLSPFITVSTKPTIDSGSTFFNRLSMDFNPFQVLEWTDEQLYSDRQDILRNYLLRLIGMPVTRLLSLQLGLTGGGSSLISHKLFLAHEKYNLIKNKAIQTNQSLPSSFPPRLIKLYRERIEQIKKHNYLILASVASVALYHYATNSIQYFSSNSNIEAQTFQTSVDNNNLLKYQYSSNDINNFAVINSKQTIEQQQSNSALVFLLDHFQNILDVKQLFILLLLSLLIFIFIFIIIYSTI